MTNTTFFNRLLDLFEYMIHQMFLNILMKEFLFFIILVFVVWAFRKIIHV